jgi:phosphoribosyl 1,2-cyclic phosphate phosphodiesterase
MEKARLTFLGTGTSQGIPIIGCHCRTCTSEDPRDNRLRSSVFVQYCGLDILVDAGPDFRYQMLRQKIVHLDDILLTHNHKDHTGGLDDVRSFNYIEKRPAEIYCEEHVLATLKQEYAYAFEEKKYPGAPEWHVHLIENKPFIVYENNPKDDLVWVKGKGYYNLHPDGTMTSTDGEEMVVKADGPGDHVDQTRKHAEIIPIRGMHGEMPVLGFRFGNIAYITDMNYIPDEEFEKLHDLDHVTLNTVSYQKHHTHFSLSEAIDVAHRIGARHTWLTHLSHQFPPHEEFCKELPDDIQPSYDGLVIE